MAEKNPPFLMPTTVNVEGEQRTTNLPKREKIFKDFLKSLEFAPLEDEILEIQFSLVSTNLAKRLDSLDTMSKSFLAADTTNLVLKVDGKVFPSSGYFLGKDF